MNKIDKMVTMLNNIVKENNIDLSQFSSSQLDNDDFIFETASAIAKQEIQKLRDKGLGDSADKLERLFDKDYEKSIWHMSKTVDGIKAIKKEARDIANDIPNQITKEELCDD